ncbi:MAG TPA: DCC1-like thiol-disulfide oxidoreductase family protein [Fimbriimonadaceae bacterium]|nr:DCC1-like thiol-disulfide oxidoreductase family protein [Fimbriimonadaceae bacterium]
MKEPPGSEGPGPGLAGLEEPVLFFDGVCNLCNRSVDWIMRRDRRRVFRFASLQGETAKEVVPEFAKAQDLSTVVLVANGRKFVRSSAVIEVLKGLGGSWRVLGCVLRVVPRPLRDWGYDRVAKARYRRWGKRDTCRVPGPEERERFLP